MKAWQMLKLGDPWKGLTIKELDSPRVSRETVRIRVEATDLNFADILQSQGKYQIKVTPPFTPGLNSLGVVLEAGVNSEFKAGDRIVGPCVAPYGGYAEEAILLSQRCQRVPNELEAIQAMGAHVTHGTSWFALHQRAQLQPGETVLVLAAAGGVGSAAVQMARAHGCWVAAAASGQQKTALCHQLGADLVIDYEIEDLYQKVSEATDGRGVDVVYDPVGGDYFDIARRLVAFEGRLLVVGFASGRIPNAPMNHALVKNYSIVGVHMAAYREKLPHLVSECYEELHKYLLEGTYKAIVTDTIEFDALPIALEQLANRSTTGRIVFTP
ncbi:MAG TPA: alcohol dehydrogenase [Gammaproteobacteria bacterium]|nr:alcohol dehydrogenase [Gammaproteobacteria bacterium]